MFLFFLYVKEHKSFVRFLTISSSTLKKFNCGFIASKYIFTVVLFLEIVASLILVLKKPQSIISTF